MLKFLKNCSLSVALLVFSSLAFAQGGIIGPKGIIGSGTAGTPYNWVVQDWHACTATSAITAACSGNSATSAPTGSSWSTPGSNLTAQTAAHYDILSSTVNLTHGGNYLDGGTLGMQFAPQLGTTTETFNLYTGVTSSSSCFSLETTAAQNVASFSRVDNVSMYGSGTGFLTAQTVGNGTTISYNLESAPAQSGQLIPGVTAAPTFSSNTPYIICGQYVKNGTIVEGIWNSSTGALIAIANGTDAGNTAPTAFEEGNLSSNTGPASGVYYYGQSVTNYNDAASSFPMVPSPPGVVTLQLPTPTDSPGPGIYGTGGATATISDFANNIGQFALYTTNGSTPSCPSTGTTYSSGISITVTTTLQEIECGTGYAASAVQSSVYTVTSGPVPDPAPFTGLNGSCAITTGCTFNIGNVTSGDLITVAFGWQTTSVTIAVTDNCNTGATSNTYTVRTGPTSGGSGRGEQLSAPVGATTSNCTIKVVPSATTSMNIAAIAWKQVASGCDVCNTALTTSGTTTSNVTIVQTDSVFVWGYDAGGSGGTFSAGTGYVLGAQTITWSVGNEYAANQAAATFSATFPYSGSTTHLILGIMTVH